MRGLSRMWGGYRPRNWMLAVLLFQLLLPGLPPGPGGSPLWARLQAAAPQAVSRKMETRIDVTLAVSGTLRLGEPFTLDARITPLDDAPDVYLRWSIPAGGELLDGPVEESLGAMAAGETRIVTRRLRLAIPGAHRVGVEASFKPQEAITYGDAAILFVTVDENGGSVSDQDAQALAELQAEIPLGPDAGATPYSPEDPNSPGADCANIFGRVTRIDRVSNGITFTDTRIPVTNVIVEIWEDDPIFDDHDGTSVPNANGEFGWTACTGDGLFDDEREYYAKVIAKSEGTIDEVVVKVLNAVPSPGPVGGYRAVYSFRTEGTVETTGGQAVNFGEFELNETQSAVINIAETGFDAWKFWNDQDPGGTDYEDIAIFWTPGFKGDGTHYTPFWDDMHVSGETSDPDEWDDSVIIHEWGHFADDKWGCDDNPGGSHTFNDHVNTRLAWGEGFPDFYQSAVRQNRNDPRDPNVQIYRDSNAMAGCAPCADIENVDTLFPARLGDDNEVAIAATLWDLIDTNNEGQDRVNLGFPLIQNIFKEQRATCTLRGYFRSWPLYGGPTDADVAAVVTQNTTIADIFGTVASDAIAQARAIQAAEAMEAGLVPISAEGEGDAAIQPEIATTEDYRWWERLTFIVDNSKSMEGARIDAVRDVIDNRVQVLSNLEQGVEFRLDTFDNGGPGNTRVFAGQFYPELIQGAIDSLDTISADDPGCEVDAFPALQQAVAGQTGVDAWLFTDNYPLPSHTPIEALRAELSTRDVRASFALLQAPDEVTPCASSEAFDFSTRQFQLQQQLLFAGSPSPTEPADSIVPYLLTAIATGGQFFFVDDDQLNDAARILQAQIDRSAGAGRWSDYVSNQPTYRFDRLTPSEYEWIAADVVGTEEPVRPGGGADPEGYIDVTLPSEFTFYTRTATVAHVFENGYITFGDNLAKVKDNTGLPDPAAPNAALYPYWDDLGWTFITAQAQQEAPTSPQDAVFGNIYTAQVDDWFVIQYDGFYSTSSNCPADPFPTACELFQALLNLETGEIRYQYHTISGDVSGATIGLESWPDMNPVSAVEVSENVPDGAESGMGYRFWPVPAQPLKTYSVTVDATMESIGFLLTGFDGTLAPMVVRTPNGNALNCNAGDNLCINLGNVQYVQANVTPNRVGVWHIEVSPGASGSGTFAFSSMAAGPLPAVSPTDHTRPAFGNSVILLDMGQPVDGNQLDAHFQTPGDLLFGTPFAMHDDGAHGDGGAGDGLFGSAPINPGETGSAYLWVTGEISDTAFTRMDTRLFSFQPLRLTAPAALTALNAQNPFDVRIFNDDTVTHTYALRFQAPLDWRVEVGAGGTVTHQIAAGQSVIVPLMVSVGISDTAALAVASGVNGLLNIAALEVEQGAMYDSASMQVTRQRRVNRVEIYNPYDELYPGNAPVYLQVGAFDNTGATVADGTRINLSTTMGTISPSVFLQGGWADVRFVPGNQTGTAEITATSLNNRTASTEIEIQNPRGESITLVSTETSLPSDGTSTARLTATVRDRQGNVVEGQSVRIIVEGGGDEVGDNEFGTINGGEAITRTTNANGNVVAIFTVSDRTGGTVGVRAELLRGGNAIDEARIEIQIEFVLTRKLYVPIINRR